MEVNKKKYHILDDGTIKECEANVRRCKYEKNGGHFSSLSQAEDHSKGSLHGSLSSSVVGEDDSSAVEQAMLSSLFPIEDLQRNIDLGFVSVRSHESDPRLVILSYTRMAHIKGVWNRVTKATRGLVVYKGDNGLEDATIVARPWEKFYTLQQMDQGWHLGDEDAEDGAADDLMGLLDFDAPAEVTDKMDGSMGVLYRAPDGRLAFATKGSFHSEQAEFYTSMLRNNPSLESALENAQAEHPSKTLIFEMIGPSNPIVLEYDRDQVSMLGMVDNHSGLYHSAGEARSWIESGGEVTETMKATTLTEALKLSPRKGREGVVVRIKADTADRQMMVKIKQEDYLTIHRVLSHTSPSVAREILSSGSLTLDEALSAARSGDMMKIHSVRKSMDDMVANSGAAGKIAKSKILEFMKPALLEVQSYARSYDRAKSLSASPHLPGEDNRSRQKRLARLVQDDNSISAEEKSYTMSIVGNMLRGEYDPLKGKFGKMLALKMSGKIRNVDKIVEE